MDDAVRDRVRQIVRESVGVETTRDNVDMIETGRLDSLGLVELLVAIERDLGVTIPMETLEIDNFRTVVSISDFIGVLQVAASASVTVSAFE